MIKQFITQLEVTSEDEIFPQFLIQLENKSFINQFIQLSGLNTIDKILKKGISSANVQQYVMESYFKIFKVNSTCFIESKEILITIYSLIIKSKTNYPRKLGLKMIRKLLLESEENYKIIIEWIFNLYSKVHQEPIRFSHLMIMVRLEQDEEILKQFFKLLKSLKNHQNELNDLGLEDIYKMKSVTDFKMNESLESYQLLMNQIYDTSIKNETFSKYFNLIKYLSMIVKENSEEKYQQIDKNIRELLNIEKEEVEQLVYERKTCSIYCEWGLEDDLEIGMIIQACPKLKLKKKLLSFDKDHEFIIEILIDYLLKNINIEFLFRITKKKFDSLKQDLLNQKDISNYNDPHVVSSLLKHLLIEYPLITIDSYPLFLNLLNESNQDKKLLSLKNLLTSLSKYQMIKKLFTLLFIIVRSSEVNKMNSFQLSNLFTSILFSNDQNNSKSYQKIIYLMIKNAIYLFDIQDTWKQDYICLGSDDEDNFQDNTIEKEKKIFMGFQSKKNPLTHKWGKVYVVLKDDQLYYYNTMEEYQKSKKALGQISLNFAVCDQEERKGHKACYSIFSNGKTYLFESESELERSNWIREIKQIISNLYEQKKE